MVEELHELVEAMWKTADKDPVLLDAARVRFIENKYAEVADGIADLLYVVFYTANCYGLDMKSIFSEIQRSNLSKSGGTIDKNGKLRKEDLPNYSPPNLVPIIMEQINSK